MSKQPWTPGLVVGTLALVSLVGGVLGLFGLGAYDHVSQLGGPDWLEHAFILAGIAILFGVVALFVSVILDRVDEKMLANKKARGETP